MAEHQEENEMNVDKWPPARGEVSNKVYAIIGTLDQEK